MIVVQESKMAAKIMMKVPMNGFTLPEEILEELGVSFAGVVAAACLTPT